MHGTDIMSWEHEALRRREQLLEEARAAHSTSRGGWSLGDAIRRSWQPLSVDEPAAAPCPEVGLARG